MRHFSYQYALYLSLFVALCSTKVDLVQASQLRGVNISALIERTAQTSPEPTAVLTREGKQALPIEWLHIPKCGTSFSNSLLRLLCFPDLNDTLVFSGGGYLLEIFDKSPACKSHFFTREVKYRRKQWPIGEHYALPEEMEDDELARVVTILREPVHRSLSHAFYVGKTIENELIDGMQLEKHYGIDFSVTNRINEAIVKHHVEHTRVNNGFLDIACYQTYFITGKCDASIESIHDRLPRLGFIGITSLWETSLCSFYHKFANDTLTAGIGMKNTRPSRVDYFSSNPSLMALFKGVSHSWIDSAMFRLGVKILLESIKGTKCASIARAEIDAIDPHYPVKKILEMEYKSVF